MREKNLRLVCPAVSVPPMTHGMSLRSSSAHRLLLRAAAPNRTAGILAASFFSRRDAREPRHNHMQSWRAACNLVTPGLSHARGLLVHSVAM